MVLVLEIEQQPDVRYYLIVITQPNRVKIRIQLQPFSVSFFFFIHKIKKKNKNLVSLYFELLHDRGDKASNSVTNVIKSNLINI